jgi:beta-lactamase class A
MQRRSTALVHGRQLAVMAAVASSSVALSSCLAAQERPAGGIRHLEADIAELAKGAGGIVGIAAIHIESNRTVYHNADLMFPMASTYKVPIAVQVLTRVDRGEIPLDTMITVTPRDLVPGDGTITYQLHWPGVSLSISNLIELMITKSDNTATDLLFKLGGGPKAVTTRMKELGFDRIKIDRYTREIIGDWLNAPNYGALAPDSQVAYINHWLAGRWTARDSVFDSDPRDIASPREVAALLVKIWRREALSERTAARLLDIMTRTTTGPSRIGGVLPSGTVVMHKTGDIGWTANDIAIITLPRNAGHIALAAYVKSSRKPVADRDVAMAHIARAIYDYFLFVR